MLFTLGRVLEIMSLRKQYQHIRYSREWKCNAWKKYNARDKHHKDVKNKEDRFRQRTLAIMFTMTKTT